MRVRVLCVCACVVIVITCVLGGISSTILRESLPRNMKLSRDVIDVIGDETKPASRDR